MGGLYKYFLFLQTDVDFRVSRFVEIYMQLELTVLGYIWLNYDVKK